MLIRNTVFPFLTLAISLSVQGAPTGFKPRGNSHIAITRNAAGFLEERDAPFNDETLILRSGERFHLVARQQQKGQKSGPPELASDKDVVNSWGKNRDKNRRKKAKQRAKAKLRKAAANANSVHPAVTAKTVGTPPHVGALKEPGQAPFTEAEKKLELGKAAEKEKEEEEKKKDGGESKKEELKPVIPEHKETPAEKKEELNHPQTTEGEAPAPPTGADLTTAATAAVGSLAQLAPMIAQGMAAGGSAGASSAIANDVMGGGASGSPNSGSSSNAGSSSSGEGVPPSSTGSSSSSNSSGDTGSSGSDSSTSSNKGEGEKEEKGDEDGGKKDDDATGDVKGDGDGNDNGKSDESSNSEDDKKTDSKKKSPDSDSGLGSTEENGTSTKSPKGNDGAGMRKRGTDLYLRGLMSLD
ncbi:hypothetical protein EV368DRAFT_82247 [Lentinula lateritia]|uniref:Uncharacterized protein n=1 Tax=Lentinula aff. lateritia TaxID=2804960 RepID=A0ACC1TWY9_9AGAR|nr:hypothetical protein F5876DRAFT_77957 [Lentinula aff. lateritia]KAJ3852716.1 hypothetical protein EV368DRAFT_82247 [Lentinula lateritia]